jgi:hypothetical protein
MCGETPTLFAVVSFGSTSSTLLSRAACTGIGYTEKKKKDSEIVYIRTVDIPAMTAEEGRGSD